MKYDEEFYYRIILIIVRFDNNDIILKLTY